MHEEIVRFQREGYCDNNASNRKTQVDDLESEMRDKGYVPSIDNSPQYTVEYDRESELFYFSLSVYGMKVGKDKSWQVSGLSNGKAIMKYTPRIK